MILQVLATPGNVLDAVVLPTLAQPLAKELTGDQAYDSNANRTHLANVGVASGFYPSASTWTFPEVLAGAPPDRKKVRRV